MTDDSKNMLIRSILYLFIGLIIFIITIYGSVDKPPYGFIITISISFIFMSIARLLRGTWKYKRMLFVCKFFGFIGLFNILIFYAIAFMQNSNVKTDSALLINRIEEFKKDNGKYPDNLKDLAPKYIKEIPKIWIGLKKMDFNYKLNRINDSKVDALDLLEENAKYEFQISYKRFFGEVHVYNNKDKNWIIK